MGDKCAPLICKLLSSQSERRDNVVWLAGLRGEAPESKSYKNGLQSIILRYNSFKDFTASEISRVLLYDIYLRSIDMRNNLIKEKGTKELFSVMKSNKTLLNLDLRGNSGFTSIYHRKIAIKLLNNIRKAQNDNDVDEHKWMNPELLTIEVPEHLLKAI